MPPNDASRVANSKDPDHTGSALFAQTCLSENLRSLQYSVRNMLDLAGEQIRCIFDDTKYFVF